jgi:hypothetical protein
MNERIRELAIQAGDDWNQTLPSDREFLHKFAELVRADERERIIEKNKPEIEKVNAYIKDLEQAVLAEREACAKVCEEISDSAHALWKVDADPTEQGRDIGAEHCAQAIRARGSEDGLR